MFLNFILFLHNKFKTFIFFIIFISILTLFSLNFILYKLNATIPSSKCILSKNLHPSSELN